MDKLIGFLRLMRPANIITSIADILAGVAIAGYVVDDGNAYEWQSFGLLVFSTIGLY